MPNEFSPNRYPLGEVPVNETREAVFLRPKGGKSISRIDSSCGCAVVSSKIKPDQEDIVVQFSAGYLPEGVKASGKTSFLVTNKFLTVIYTDDTFEHLFLEATVFEPGAEVKAEEPASGEPQK